MPLSGKEMLNKFLKAGWVKVSHKSSSHVQIKKGDRRETITMHKELKKGLEKHLLKRLEED